MMKRFKLFLVSLLLLLPLAVLGQDRVGRGGAKVQANADGSVTVTLAVGKTFRIVPQPALPGSCADGQFSFMTNVGLHECVNGEWQSMRAAAAGVTSFNSRSGIVSLSSIDVTDALAYTPVPSTRTVNGHPLSSNVTVTKSDVGLGNADNTSDANKPISTATQTALNTKALQSAVDGKQPLDSDLTAIAALSPSNDDLIQRKAGAWTNRTPAQFKTDLALTKSDVNLSNVDNTSDVNKPISTATQTALNAKQNSLGFTAENIANKDTDSTLAANSDTKYASQKATKTYVDAKTDPGYLVYEAFLSQTGTGAPVVVVKKNTLGGNPVWARLGVGQYGAELAGAFPSLRTGTIYSSRGNVHTYTPGIGGDYILVNTWNIETNALEDGLLLYTLVEIRVYP